jgi:hypothetical protein
MSYSREVHESGEAAQTTGAAKHDGGKVRLELVPPDVVFALGSVLTFGAQKYAANNWCKGMDWSRAYGALQRHLQAWWACRDLDAETGMSHLWHALCELAFLVTYEMRGVGRDDRHRWESEVQPNDG